MSSGYVQQGQKWGQQIQSELSQLSSYSPVQLEQYVDKYQQQYCTPASITPEMKMPGNYTGEKGVFSQLVQLILSGLEVAARSGPMYMRATKPGQAVRAMRN